MRADVDSIRFSAHECGADDHPLADETNGQTQVMAKERPAPRFGQARSSSGRRQKESEVVRVLVQDSKTIDEFAEKVVGECAACRLLVTFGRKRSLEDTMNEFLDLGGGFVQSNTACKGVSSRHLVIENETYQG